VPGFKGDLNAISCLYGSGCGDRKLRTPRGVIPSGADFVRLKGIRKKHIFATIKDFTATGRISRPLAPELGGHGVSSTAGCLLHWSGVSFSNLPSTGTLLSYHMQAENQAFI
jgi:hypothetical protein